MLPWILCGILSGMVIVLGVKVILLKKDMKKICTALRECLSADTNILISTASRDRQVRSLAAELNVQLKQLRKQRWKYLSGDAELRDAMTNISHDLRTPLTAICGYLDLLEREDKPEEVCRYIAIIRNRTELLKQLTEELFRYSVILAAEGSGGREPVVVNRVLEESVAAFYTALGGRGIIPHIQMPEAKIIRKLDRSSLSRVFSNLLNNAVKYSDGDLEIVLSEDGEITFANTASGLNAVQTGRLFDRFYTVETAGNSTGLGLAIVKTLVEQMNGSISAEYEDGRLSVCVSFPEAEG